MRNDEQLMVAAGRGDLEAFEELVLRHQAGAWRVAYRLTGDAHQAEDLAQEGFLRVLDAAEGYRPTASFRTWLFRILTRLHIDRCRKKTPVYTDQLPGIDTHQAAPEDPVLREEQDAAIQSALAGLPARQRSAVVLRYFEGWSGADVAEALGVSPKAVERLLARARKSLAGRLKEWLED